MTMKRSIVNEMIELAKSGFTLPVIEYMTAKAATVGALDYSILQYTVEKILDMGQPPYSMVYQTYVNNLLNQPDSINVIQKARSGNISHLVEKFRAQTASTSSLNRSTAAQLVQQASNR